MHEIPQVGPAAKGKAIVNLLNLDADEKIATTVAVRDFPTDHFLVFATEKGTDQEDATLGRVRQPALAAASSPSTSTKATACWRSR